MRDVTEVATAARKHRGGGKGAVVLWVLCRWTLAFLIIYGYAIFLGSVLDRTPPGHVRQNVELGPVDVVGSEESPLGLQSTDLEWIDVNNTLQRKNGLIVGNVPVDRQCDVTEVPTGFRNPSTSTTRTTISGSSTTLPGGSSGTIVVPPGASLPPGFTVPPGVSVVTADPSSESSTTSTSTSTTTTTPGPPAQPGTAKVEEAKKVCAQAIEITYDPASPAATVQVVGAKDIEVGAPALAFLVVVGMLGFFALLIALGSSGFPAGQSGSVAWGIVLIILGIGCLAVGPLFVKEQPVLAMSMAAVAVYFFMRGSTSIRRKLHKSDPNAATEGPTPGAQGPSEGPPAPFEPSPAQGPPPSWPTNAPGPPPPGPPPQGPPTPWQNPPPQPPFQPPPAPQPPQPPGTTSF